MTLAGFWLVFRYGLDMPFADDWAWLGQVTGEEPVTWNWLWGQHNEHRTFLPRLIYLGLGELSGFDFRAGAYFNVAVLSVCSLLMMRVVRSRRGSACWHDAIFPLAMLQWGSYSNLIWGFQMCFVVSSSLSMAALLPVFCCRGRPSVAAALLTAGCLLGAGLCGAIGLAFLPPLAGWLFLAAVLPATHGGRVSPSYRIVLAGLALILAGFFVFYFVGFSRPGQHAAAPSTMAALRTTGEFLAASLGPAGEIIWPFSGLLVLAGCGLALRELLRTLVGRPEERLRAAGFLAWLAAMLLLAAAIGWGRAFLGPGTGFTDRYMLLAAPLWGFFSLVWTAYASPGQGERLQRAALLLLCVSALVAVHKGYRCAADLFTPTQAFGRDARTGLSPKALAARYCDHYGFGATPETFARWMEMLRNAELGPYRGRPLQPLAPVVVERLVEMPQPSQPARLLTIPAGKSFVQPFKAAASGVLYRIDLPLLPFNRRGPAKLDWTLLRVAPSGAKVVWASGEIRLRAMPHEETATLLCPPQSLEKGQALELQLHNPAADGGRVVRLFVRDPVASDGSNPAISGFLFLAKDRAVAERMSGNVP